MGDVDTIEWTNLMDLTLSLSSRGYATATTHQRLDSHSYHNGEHSKAISVTVWLWCLLGNDPVSRIK